MAVHNKKLVTKKFPQGNKIGTTPVQKTVPGPYGTTKTKTYQKPQVGKTTTAGRNLTKKRALISKLKKLGKTPLAKKIPYVGTPLTVLSIAQKVKKIVSPKFPGSPKLPIGKKNFSYWKDFQVPIPKANTVSYSGKLNKGTRDFTGLLEKISKTPNKVLLKRLNKNKL
jgi:hypothetical protein